MRSTRIRKVYFAELKSVGASDEEIAAIQRYGTPVLHQRIDTQATRAALAGVEGTGEIIGYRGVPTLASWGPLAIADVKWALVAKIDSAEAFAPIAQLRRDLLIVGGLALLVVAATAAWLSRALLGPLRELTAGVKRFAAGDYAASVPVRTRDEIGQLCSAFNGMVEDLRQKNIEIENKNRENEELLLNVLPAPIANRLRGGEERIADGFAEVTVAFADLVGFTALTSEMPPQEVVTFLNGLFTRFDVAANDLGIEKIKTVGDAYMAVCGLPEPVANHAERMVRMAIRMVHITREHAMEHNVSMKLRVGVNSGPVVAGVIGKSKYIYDLWGDTVNLASRMESGGIPDSVQVTRPVYEQLKDQFVVRAARRHRSQGQGKGGGLALAIVEGVGPLLRQAAWPCRPHAPAHPCPEAIEGRRCRVVACGARKHRPSRCGQRFWRSGILAERCQEDDSSEHNCAPCAAAVADVGELPCRREPPAFRRVCLGTELSEIPEVSGKTAKWPEGGVGQTTCPAHRRVPNIERASDDQSPYRPSCNCRNDRRIWPSDRS